MAIKPWLKDYKNCAINLLTYFFNFNSNSTVRDSIRVITADDRNIVVGFPLQQRKKFFPIHCLLEVSFCIFA